MCGIVGYVGDEQAAPILLAGLSKLEYRGYDSAGIAVRNEAADKIAIVKAKGRLKTLIEKTDGEILFNGEDISKYDKKPYRVPAVSVIPAGRLMESLLRQMPILIVQMISP